MMEEQDRLKSLKEKRERAEFEYYQFKKRAYESRDYIDFQRKQIEKMMESRAANSDPALMELYERKMISIKEFEEKQGEYLEAYEKEWRKMNDEMDAEEQEIKDFIEKQEKEEQEKRVR